MVNCGIKISEGKKDETMNKDEGIFLKLNDIKVQKPFFTIIHTYIQHK